MEGSPPRMRGKDFGDLAESSFVRITPAHAGKRAFRVIASKQSRDHPRACGEKTKKIP